VFKRRKPEDPPASPEPPPRGHVVASGPELPFELRPEKRTIFEMPVTTPATSRAPDQTLVIPEKPEAALPKPSPVVTTPPQTKEPIFMSRPPLQPTPTSPSMPQGMPQGMTQGLSRSPLAPVRMPPLQGERRTLVVGRGISVQGTITDAERLVVEGTVEASSLNAAELQIAQGGVLKGQVEVEDAEISGLMDGILTVKGSLVLRGTGQVIGEARCRRLQVEDGGQLSGKISMIGGEAVPPLHMSSSSSSSSSATAAAEASAD
jgi:cytoskeletal protein CcmA (bactofilin family)